MKKILLITISTLLPFISAFGELVYSNSFESATNLDEFIVTVKRSATINITQGQLKISSYDSPGGFGYGRVTAMLNVSNTLSGLNSILSSNPGKTSWGVNLSNADGFRNNSAEFVLASTSADPFALDAHGYAVTVGGSAGDRMSFFRFDYGLGGGRETLISIDNGLSLLPSNGTLRVEYNPSSDYWEMYFSQGDAYQNPMTIDSLVGFAYDSEYTGTNLNYMGLAGSTSGEDYFDNLSVSVIPEPFTIAFFAPAFFVIYLLKRKATR